jgi:hypothetical protein
LCIEKKISILEELYKVKLVVLNIRDNHINMFDKMSDLEKIETTIRI